MDDSSMTLHWRQQSEKNDYWYGTTGTRFSAQIGKSTNAGLYMWMIFHEDFCYSIYGEEVASVKAAMAQAQAWLDANAKPLQVELSNS
jgi:hypothetical protein